MSFSLRSLISVLLLGLLVLSGACASRLLLSPPALETGDGLGEWIDARASWFQHPYTGSCGYGKLDGMTYGVDAVAAMPDVAADYNTSCGRCYEIKCRGMYAVAADHSEAWERWDACYNMDSSIIIKVVDTCPCNGNQKWCCGDMPHFDLSYAAFARLAPQGKGIIGLKYRPVPCELGPTPDGNSTSSSASSGSAAPAKTITSFDANPWDSMDRALELGASENVFMHGEFGLGWKKSMYGDTLRAMYTYANALVPDPADGSTALCDTYSLYGGQDFHTQNQSVSLFSNAKAVEFWVQTSGGNLSAAGIPDLTFQVANLMRGSCTKDFPMASHATSDVVNGWTRFYFPLADFQCTGDVKLSDVNRLQWENRNPTNQSMCLRDVRVILNDSFSGAGGSEGSTGAASATSVTTAGRR